MPEGPEVLITAQFLDSKIRNKIIESITLTSSKKYNSIDIVKNNEFKVEKVDSKGKFLWMVLKNIDNNESIYLMNWFGLKGRWQFNCEKDDYCRLKMVIKSKTQKGKTYDLYFVDSIGYGNIEITNDYSKLQKKLNDLAPDIIKSNISNNELYDIIKKNNSRKNIVKVLMEDQKAIVSGIGNYMIAEILYDAKINPHRNLNDLSDNEKMQLAKSIRKIGKYAYYVNTTDYVDYLSAFMKTHSKKIDNGIFPNYHADIKPKHEFIFNAYKKKYDSIGNPITTDSIIKERTIYWAPNVQK
jgi:formamidopyrimidine-DNA glycosylase